MDTIILSQHFCNNKICKDANINGHERGWLSEKLTLMAADINGKTVHVVTWTDWGLDQNHQIHECVLQSP